MVGRIVGALICFVLAALAQPRIPDAAPAPMLTAGSDTVHVGDVFTIPIPIANVQGLTAFQFDLAFNPTIITALSFTDSGTDFEMAAANGGGFLTGITGFIDDTTGLLSGVADSISGLTTGNGRTPGGVLVDIDFQALASGISPLTLSNAFLTDNGVPLSSANGDFALQDGQVTVLGSAVVPEPGVADPARLRARRAGAAAPAPGRWRLKSFRGNPMLCAAAVRAADLALTKGEEP